MTYESCDVPTHNGRITAHGWGKSISICFPFAAHVIPAEFRPLQSRKLFGFFVNIDLLSSEGSEVRMEAVEVTLCVRKSVQDEEDGEKTVAWNESPLQRRTFVVFPRDSHWKYLRTRGVEVLYTRNFQRLRQILASQPPVMVGASNWIRPSLLWGKRKRFLPRLVIEHPALEKIFEFGKYQHR